MTRPLVRDWFLYTLTQMPIFLTCRSRPREVDRITVDILVINISRFNSLFKKRTIFQTVPRKAYAVNCELLHHQNYLGYRFLNRWATTQASIIVLPDTQWWSMVVIRNCPTSNTTDNAPQCIRARFFEGWLNLTHWLG